MSCTIEPASDRDYLHVAALDRISWPTAPDLFIPDGEHIWRIWCDMATLLVARLPDTSEPLSQSGDIAGALVMFPTNAAELCLHKIMVHSDCRGAGIGSELMRAGLDRAEAPVLLTVEPSRGNALPELWFHRPPANRRLLPAAREPADHGSSGTGVTSSSESEFTSTWSCLRRSPTRSSSPRRIRPMLLRWR